LYQSDNFKGTVVDVRFLTYSTRVCDFSSSTVLTGGLCPCKRLHGLGAITSQARADPERGDRPLNLRK